MFLSAGLINEAVCHLKSVIQFSDYKALDCDDV